MVILCLSKRDEEGAGSCRWFYRYLMSFFSDSPKGLKRNRNNRTCKKKPPHLHIDNNRNIKKKNNKISRDESAKERVAHLICIRNRRWLTRPLHICKLTRTGGKGGCSPTQERISRTGASPPPPFMQMSWICKSPSPPFLAERISNELLRNRFMRW